MTVDEALAWAREQLPTTDPAEVVSGLEAAGWVRVGYRAGVCVRLAWSDRHDRRCTVFVPLDRDAPEYPEWMVATLADIRVTADVGRQAQQMLDGLGKCPTCHSPGARPLYPAPCEDVWHEKRVP